MTQQTDNHSDNAEQDLISTVATVSRNIGVGDQQYRIIRIGNWALNVWSDEEPRIRDLDLAEKIGLAQPRGIRKVINSCIENGELPHVFTREATQLVEKSGAIGGTEKRTIQEYWLTEPEALFIVSRCHTPKAVALTWEMVNVYTLARKGLLPGQNGNGLALAREDVIAIVEQAMAPILALVQPIAALTQYPDRYPSRAELRDYPKECSECAALIRRAAEASGVTWHAIHGRLLRHYQIRSYRRLPWPLWALVRESLLQWIINPDPTTAPASMVIRQLPLFAQCA